VSRHGPVTTMSTSDSDQGPTRHPQARSIVRSGYDARYASLAASPLVAQLFHDGLGSDLPAEIQPYSFVPLAGLHAISEALALQPGQHLVDLGCGRGGPGLFLAATNGARLTGVDSSAVALDQARDRIRQFYRGRRTGLGTRPGHVPDRARERSSS
jgi:SAM-dependent methyltransferase